MEKMAALWLLFAGLNFALAEDAYFKEGGKLRLDLRPPSSEPISYILWKFDGNLLGEWVKDVVDLTYYSTFQGRTTLDTNTGRLEISSMTKADVGVYSVEINNKLQPEQYKAVLIKDVPEPEVWIRPLTCGSTSEKCTATCEGDTTDAGPVTYSWKMGDREWTAAVKTIDITKTDSSHVKTFTCRVENPLGEKVSEGKANPLFMEEVPGGPDVGGIVGGVIALVLAGGVGGALFVAWRQKKGPFKNRGSTGPDAAPAQPLNANGTPDETPAAENREQHKDAPDKDAAAEKVPLESPNTPAADEDQIP